MSLFLKPLIIFSRKKSCNLLLSLNLHQLNVVNLKSSVCSSYFSSLTVQPRRCKSRKAKDGKRAQTEEVDEDSSDEEDNKIAGKGTETKSSTVGSMRADLLLKIGLGLARNKIEEAFYDSRIRVNSKKIFKKSAQVRVGDDVDFVKGPSPANPSFILVGRVEVLAAKARDDGEGITVKMRRSKSLVIDNYPDGDPWKPSDTSGSGS